MSSEKKEVVVEQISDILRRDLLRYGIILNYNPQNQNKNSTYYERTRDFFNSDGIIRYIIGAFAQLSQKIKESTKEPYNYILIDGENIFYNMSSDNIFDFLLDLMYNHNYPYIVIFCQEHSVTKKLQKLNNFLLKYPNYDITIFSDDMQNGKLKLLKRVIEKDIHGLKSELQDSYLAAPPRVPSQSECDDILLMICYLYLKRQGRNVKVLTYDNMNWSSQKVIFVEDKINDAQDFYKVLERERRMEQRTRRDDIHLHPIRSRSPRTSHTYGEGINKKYKTKRKPKLKKQKTKRKLKAIKKEIKKNPKQKNKEIKQNPKQKNKEIKQKTKSKPKLKHKPNLKPKKKTRNKRSSP